jgi:hypothetical protein
MECEGGLVGLQGVFAGDVGVADRVAVAPEIVLDGFAKLIEASQRRDRSV